MSLTEDKKKEYSELNMNIEENSFDFEFDELNDEIDKVLNSQKLKEDSFEENSSLNTTPTPNPIRNTQTFSYDITKLRNLNQNFFALTENKNNYFKKQNPQFSLTPIENNKFYYFNQSNIENNFNGFYATPQLNSNFNFMNNFNKNSNFIQINNQMNLMNNNFFIQFNNNNYFHSSFNHLNNNSNKYFSVNINNQKANDEIILNNMKNKLKKNHKNLNPLLKRKISSQNLQDEEKEHNIIDIDLIIKGIDKRTTLMIKNIPNKYTINIFLDEINIEFKNKYDLFYLPIDYGNKCNLGFAFINFVDSFHIINFYDLYRGKKWKKFNSEKTCELLYAKIQGKKDLISHFEKGKVLSFNSEDKRPLILPTPNPLPNVILPFKFYNTFKKLYPYTHFIIHNEGKDNQKFSFNSQNLIHHQ